jgi:hypothetical protein
MRRLAPLLLVVALLGPAQTACSDPCEDTGCGPGGAHVSWREGEVPDAARYRLCIDGRCHPVEPRAWEDPETDVVVEAGEGRPEEPVPVRLEAIDGDGEVVAVFAGEREATGACCSVIQLRVEAPDRLVGYDS